MGNDILKTIIKTAISNEEKGSRFYARMAQKTVDKKIKNIFEKLSREEQEHKSAFEKLLRHEMGNSSEEIPEKEAKLLEALVKTGVFHQMNEGDGAAVKSPVEALAIGILAEKDSILLYQGIYNQTNSKVVREMMSRLLEEEKMHLVELREQMEEISAGTDQAF
ncbi:MAG: ferritin family protein [Bacillota bacterium]